MSCHDAPARIDPTRRPLVALVGNPNVGKTLLFNRLTGQNARVGNYPGITVERRSGELKLRGPEGVTRIELVDIPGAYSLSARSPEEQIALDALLGLAGDPRPDLVLVVLDATKLVRNLYLALQIIELGLPVVLALNLYDEAGDDPPDPRSVAHLLGVPCVATSARTGLGIAALRKALLEALQAPPIGQAPVAYPPAADADVAAVIAALPATWRAAHADDAALARWALLSVDDEDELEGLDPGLRAAVGQRRDLAQSAGRDLDLELVGARYAFLDAHAADLHRPPPARNLTERIDKVLLHPVVGFALFLGLMLVVFQALFSWSDPAIALIEDTVGWLGASVGGLLPDGHLTSLLVDGIIGGVGSVIVFLPQILLLFLFIGILEDSGYMARVAYLMDRIMRALGLHGRAFVPMLSGFACAVPAILATRTMERKRDRTLTMMVIPLMTCSARLPVYTLVIGALFAPSADWGAVPVQGLLMVAMYVFSVVVALLAAGVIGRTVLKGQRVPLILELPPYRLPLPKSVFRLMIERSKVFLKEAGTVILACTVLMWGLLRFPGTPEPLGGLEATSAEVQAEWRAEQIENSAAGHLGKFIEPAIRPLGFDWQIGVGIVGAFAAREVFVSTMGVVYGLGEEVDEETDSLREKLRDAKKPDGSPAYTPLMGLSLMVFFALACQCMSTLAAVKRETGGWRWPTFLFVYMTALAWVCSFVLYQGGKLLGFAG